MTEAPKDGIEIKDESMERTKFDVSVEMYEGPGGGRGSITLLNREPGQEVPKEALSLLEEKLQAGEFITLADSYDIGQCGDGRPGEFVAMKMFGGTPALARDDAVSKNNRYHAFGKDIVDAQRAMYEQRASAGKKNIAHGDDHNACGCGECNKSAEIAGLIVDDRGYVETLASTYFSIVNMSGYSDAIASVAADETKRLIDAQFYAPSGEAQLEAFRQSPHTNETDFETVRGDHKEGVYLIVINETDQPITIDRDLVAAEFEAANLQVFVENHTEIMAELDDIATSDDKVLALQHANVMRRMATAAVLTDMSLRIGVVRVKAAA